MKSLQFVLNSSLAVILLSIASNAAVAETSKSPAQEQLLNDAVDVGYLIRATEACNLNPSFREQLINKMSSILRARSNEVKLSTGSITAAIRQGAVQANEDESVRRPEPLRCIELQTEFELLIKSQLHHHLVPF